MSRLGARSPLLLAAACLGASVLLAPASAPAGAARVPACAAAALSPVYVNTSAGAGSRDGEYGFENHGRSACALRGYPTVQLRASSGAALPTSENHAEGAYGITVKEVDLARGKVAYFGIHYAAQTGYGTLHCPTSSALALTPPGLTAALVVRGSGGQLQPYGGSTVHLHCGVLDVSALSAKRFQ